MLEYHADWGYNDFYTLHSWCGLVTLAAFIALVIHHSPYVSLRPLISLSSIADIFCDFKNKDRLKLNDINYSQALFSAAVFQDFDRTKLTELRRNFKPLHIFLGVFLVFSAVIAIETGIVEKAMFREKSG